MNKFKVGLLIAGVKGLNFLKAFSPNEEIYFVASYPFKGLQCQPAIEIQDHCQKQGYLYIDSSNLNDEILFQADIIFVAGWQFLLNIPTEKLVVFHDSLLPKFRGFSPTVNALICGEKKIGVTAFRPIKEADAGPIYEQKSIEVQYPVKIRDAYSKLGDCYAHCAKQILEKIKIDKLKSEPQNNMESTYSIWRDEADLFINWDQDAQAICRYVDALGWPYQGARTFYMGQEIIIDEIEEVLPGKKFEISHPGKIWSIDSNQPEIICLNGSVRILKARSLENSAVLFKKLRERLGKINEKTALLIK